MSTVHLRMTLERQMARSVRTAHRWMVAKLSAATDVQIPANSATTATQTMATDVPRYALMNASLPWLRELIRMVSVLMVYQWVQSDLRGVLNGPFAPQRLPRPTCASVCGYGASGAAFWIARLSAMPKSMLTLQQPPCSLRPPTWN